MRKAITLVKFKDLREDEEHFGILFEDDILICLCCGGQLDKDEYEIVEDYKGFAYLDETLKEHY